jgi:hypothetical protein
LQSRWKNINNGDAEAQRMNLLCVFGSLCENFLIDCGAIGLTQRPGETKKYKGIAKQVEKY